MINQEIELKPVSVNKAWRGGRRYLTNDAKSFYNDFGLLMPKLTMIKGDVSITLEFWLKYFKTTDLSNLVKLTEDAIVKQGYIEDDRKVVEMHLYKYPSKKDRIRITISKP